MEYPFLGDQFNTSNHVVCTRFRRSEAVLGLDSLRVRVLATRAGAVATAPFSPPLGAPAASFPTMASRKRPGFVASLVRAGHPGESLLIAAGVTVAAVLSGRPSREVALVFATVLLGRLTAGWLNDAADRRRDAAAGRRDKPVAEGWLDGGTVTFTVACATCVLVPLSISNGTAAGVAHLASVLAAWLYCTRIKTTPLSFVPWAVSFALLPAFLSYGGWGGGMHGGPPTIAMTVLAGLLGIGVHVLLSLRDLVPDNKIGLRTFPLVVALRTGATKLLVAASVWTVGVLVAMSVAGASSGLVQ